MALKSFALRCEILRKVIGGLMRSNVRAFAEKKLNAWGNVLPRSEFKLNSDIEGAKINDEIGAHFVSKAEVFVNEEVPLLPLSLYLDFAKTKVRSRFEKPHHRRRILLFYLTMAEAYERKGRFVEKIADLLWAIFEETSWVIPAHYGHSSLYPRAVVPEPYMESQMPGLDLYVGATSMTVALTRHLLKNELDAISPIICKRLDYLVELRAARPFASGSFSWTGEKGTKCNNWVTHITNCVLFATAICVEDLDLRCRIVEKAMNYLDNYSATQAADGCCDEGPGYWSGAGGKYFDCLELIEDMTGGKITVYDNPFVRKLGEYIANVNIDYKYYLNFADAHPRLEQSGKMIMRFGKKCGSEELYTFGKMAEANGPTEKSYAFGAAYRIYKDSLTEEIHEADKVIGKKNVWFSDCKIAIFREFTDTSKGLYLATKGGTNSESHNHNDVGCLVVYKNGKPVIVDPSIGSYDNEFFGPKRYARWYMNSSYHSIPLVNGIEQKNGGHYESSEESFDESSRTVSMELKCAFPAEAGILSMRRTCHMGEGEATVTDAVVLNEQGEIRFNYLTLDEPKVLSEGRLEISNGAIFEYEPEGLELIIEKVENKNLPYEDLNFKGVWGRECLFRVVLVANAKEKTVRVTFR